tara:strand:+ start:159 stop:374 length:216 start_codon:yes stop_codon:yes gene_type:complete
MEKSISGMNEKTLPSMPDAPDLSPDNTMVTQSPNLSIEVSSPSFFSHSIFCFIGNASSKSNIHSCDTKCTF